MSPALGMSLHDLAMLLSFVSILRQASSSCGKMARISSILTSYSFSDPSGSGVGTTKALRLRFFGPTSVSCLSLNQPQE